VRPTRRRTGLTGDYPAVPARSATVSAIVIGTPLCCLGGAERVYRQFWPVSRTFNVKARVSASGGLVRLDRKACRVTMTSNTPRNQNRDFRFWAIAGPSESTLQYKKDDAKSRVLET
jgi:hypothetical protein